MGSALQPPAGFLLLVTGGLRAAWVPANLVERKQRLLHKRRREAALLIWYVALSAALVLWHHGEMAIVFGWIASITLHLYGANGELRKIGNST